MKPPAFDYIAATSVEDAVAALVKSEGEGKLIAGGQSLMPMLNFRLADPAVLIDIGRIPGLDAIEETDNGLIVGALTRHAVLEASPLVAKHFPVLAEAMSHVAHLAIRNRGTIGGSLSHADPAAELPLMAVALGASLHITGPEECREVSAEEFFIGALTTDLEEEEMVTAVTFPYLPAGCGWGFEEVSRRSGDFALAAAAAILTFDGPVVSEARLAVTGVDDLPLRISEAEEALLGHELTEEKVAAAVETVRSTVNPNSDAQASADFRRHLIGVLTARVLRAAAARAMGGAS
ncbi:MAG: xanthine dehydrogenase family protein subunit M [Pseudomonadota bacterium]